MRSTAGDGLQSGKRAAREKKEVPAGRTRKGGGPVVTAGADGARWRQFLARALAHRGEAVASKRMGQRVGGQGSRTDVHAAAGLQ